MLDLIPLGGLGEIGLNCLAIACRGEVLLVDCGVMFPTDATPGVDVILPDFTHLVHQRRALRGVVLTHGHEDHLGALPYLLHEVPMPVFGTRFTLALLRHKLDELGVTADLREVSPREPFRVGTHFVCEATRVTHTVPDAVGYVIRTPEGTLIHTGDYKLDPTPVDGLETDLERWGEVGDEGVLCLLADSTNSEHQDETGSEQEVAHTFARLFPEVKGRIAVGLFASNVHRVRHLLELFERLGRRVVLLGRSMQRNVQMARELGYINVPDGLLVSADEAARLPAHKVAVVTTGSQAEPRSGLSQLAGGEGAVRLGPDDLVVLSSRPIPGNERAVGALIDSLLWRGAKVVYATLEPGVHVSGHASAPQQRRVLEAVRPRHFLPVHGELRHMHRQLATARELLGLPHERLLLAKDGDVVRFEDGQARFAGEVPAGRVYRDRWGPGALTPDILEDRSRAAETGLVVASLVLTKETPRRVQALQLGGHGLALDEQVQLPQVAEQARQLVEEVGHLLLADDALVREELTRSVKRAFKLLTGKRVPVLPLVLKL